MQKIALDLDKLKAERTEIQAFLSSPDAYTSPEFSTKSKRLNELDKLITKGETLHNLKKNLAEAETIVANEIGELAELAKTEIAENEQKITT